MHLLYYYKSNGPVLACWGPAQSRLPQKLVIFGLDLGVLDLLLIIVGWLICHKTPSCVLRDLSTRAS